MQLRNRLMQIYFIAVLNIKKYEKIQYKIFLLCDPKIIINLRAKFTTLPPNSLYIAALPLFYRRENPLCFFQTSKTLLCGVGDNTLLTLEVDFLPAFMVSYIFFGFCCLHVHLEEMTHFLVLQVSFPASKELWQLL